MVVKAGWIDSRGSYMVGFWRDGLFTGFRYQAPATAAERAANPDFILPGRGPELVFSAPPWERHPFVWYLPSTDDIITF